MWFLLKSSTNDKNNEAGDLIIKLSEVTAIDIAISNDNSVYGIKIKLTDCFVHETHDSLEKTKERVLELMNAAGGYIHKNKEIIDHFDVDAGINSLEIKLDRLLKKSRELLES